MSSTTPFAIITFFTISSLLLSSSLSQTSLYNDEKPEVYIVHVSKLNKPSVFSSDLDWYTSALQSLPLHLSLLSHPREAIIYTYNHVTHGFAAQLTPSQASYLRSFSGILSILPQQIHQVQTTHTPSFLGLNTRSGLWPDSQYGSDTIIGVLDTGIWPESQSFADSGMSNIVPGKWRGVCETAPDFPSKSCNKKIIGARIYYRGIILNTTVDTISPRDINGHGTHVASTAAGSVVKHASFNQYGYGDAQGMATKARIAIYKVCWSLGCGDADIVAAMDQAVKDGVDIISMSIARSDGLEIPYDHDPKAIAAFGAVEKGVLVSAAAGNLGPHPSRADNIAPWFLTVGASTIDRRFPCNVILGNGRTIGGVSLYFGLSILQTEIVSAAAIGDGLCREGFLNPTQAAGKIVLCGDGNNFAAQGYAVQIAGGVGFISANEQKLGYELTAASPTIPGTKVTFNDAVEILNYIQSEQKQGRKPVGQFVFKGTVIGPSPSAPRVAAFSNRGPNLITPEILKPDVIAPGVDILAAWTGAAGPTNLEFDKRRVLFNIISGTSMACPHVSGFAAMLRKVYPNWSPAAIRSALMTTAYNLDNAGKPFTDLATGDISNPSKHGAGHVDPNTALNPGLVYDIQPSDYEAFLCSLGYNQRQMSLFIKNRQVDCRTHTLAGGPGDLNYPSFSVVFKPFIRTVKYKRTVTNVGRLGVATYRVNINAPASVRITVSPSTLKYTTTNQKLSYEVTFTSLIQTTKMEFGAIEWSDGVHTVRSPVAVQGQLLP